MHRHIASRVAIIVTLGLNPIFGCASQEKPTPTPPASPSKSGQNAPPEGKSEAAKPTTPSTSAPASEIERFIKMHWPRAGKLTVTGKFYYIDLVNGVNQLFRRAPGETAGTAITTFADGIGEYFPSFNGKWIAITAAIGGDEQFNVYLMNAETEKIDPILIDPETVFGSIVWNHNSDEFAYRANKESKADFHIYVYDLVSHNSRMFYNESGHWSPADFSDGSNMLAITKFTSASDSKVYELSLTGSSARPITWSETPWSFESVGYYANDRLYLVVSDYLGDKKRLFTADNVSGVLRPELKELAGFEMDTAVMNDKRDVLATVVNEDGYGTLRLFSIPALKPLPGPEIPKGVVRNVEIVGHTLLYSLENADTPGLIYQWDIDKPKSPPVCLTKADTQGVDVSKFKKPELIKYKSTDGLEIPAFLYVPDGYTKGKPIRFVVQYHGGPEGQYRPDFQRVVQYFLTRGFGVLAPNVRGSSGYGRKYLGMDDYKKRMDSVQDGVAAARWLVDNGYSKPKMIAAYGGSYGGFMVMAVITQAPDLFGAACDVVGIVNFETFLQRTKDYRRKLREAEYGPLTDVEFLRSISPIYQVDKVRTPVLIAHGKNDPRVPIDEAQQLYDKLRANGQNPTLLVFDDEGHGFVKEANRIVFYKALTDFFEKQLETSH